MTNELVDKGGLAEESIKTYFMNTAGAFAVRSLKLVHQGEEVTDVDVWIYGRSNNFSRYRQIVDIKNKKSPAVLERVLWTKGLQSILGAESAVVATTSTKRSARTFAEDHNVTIIDGAALQAIIKNYEGKQDRYPDEYLSDLVRSKTPRLKKLGELYIKSKTFLLQNLDFDGCNAWLENCRNLMVNNMSNDDLGSYSLRVLYLQISYFLIGLDFCLAPKVFDLEENRRKFLQDGLFFGELGKKGVDSVIDNGISIIKLAQNSSSISRSSVQEAINKAVKTQNFDVLVEHFLKFEVRRDLLQLAREFEFLGFQSLAMLPKDLSNEQKSLFLLLADVFGIQREVAMGINPPKEPK